MSERPPSKEQHEDPADDHERQREETDVPQTPFDDGREDPDTVAEDEKD